MRLCECVCLIRKQRRRTTRRGRWRRRSREPSWRRRKQSGRSRSASRRRSSWLTWTKVCHFSCHQRDRNREGGRQGGWQGGRMLSWSCGFCAFELWNEGVDVWERRESYLTESLLLCNRQDEAVFRHGGAFAQTNTLSNVLRECVEHTCRCPFSLFAIKSALTCQERPDGVLRYLTQWRWQGTLWVFHAWEWDLCSASVTSTECSTALGSGGGGDVGGQLVSC